MIYPGRALHLIATTTQAECSSSPRHLPLRRTRRDLLYGESVGAVVCPPPRTHSTRMCSARRCACHCNAFLCKALQTQTWNHHLEEASPNAATEAAEHYLKRTCQPSTENENARPDRCIHEEFLSHDVPIFVLHSLAVLTISALSMQVCRH